jgi:hypothetical protein
MPFRETVSALGPGSDGIRRTPREPAAKYERDPNIVGLFM